MKVNKLHVGKHVIGGRCDFCQINEAKHTINGGLWWICAACFKETYGGEEE